MDILAAQLTDPFRICLLMALLFTTRNTSGHTGFVVPVMAGIVFVALLIPVALQPEADNWWLRVVLGVISNTVLLAILLAIWWVYARLANRSNDPG